MTTADENLTDDGVQGSARELDDEILLILALLSLADVENAIEFWRQRAPQRLKGLPLARLPRTGLPVEAVASNSFPAWNPDRLAYVQRLGDEIPYAEVQAGVLAVIAKTRTELDRDTAMMLAGALTLAEWQDRLLATIKNLHLSFAIVGVGGRVNLPPQQLIRTREAVPGDMLAIVTLADLIAYQFGRARRFASDIEDHNERANTDEKIERRARMYATAGYPTYQMLLGIAALIAGFTEELNVLSIAEHCKSEAGDPVEDCPTQTDKGWVTIGELVPIGLRLCSFNCLCSTKYRDDAGRESV